MKTLLIIITGALIASCNTTTPMHDHSSMPMTSQKGVKPYSSNVCLVSGNKLGTMGKPITEVYQGRELKFCCKPCLKKFHANPEKYLKKLDASKVSQ